MIYAATGHRPAKLGGYSDTAHDALVDLAYEFLRDDAPDKVISGMALGWDTAWAEAAFYHQIPVIAAIPFRGQERMWPKRSQMRYMDLLKNCEDVVYVCDKGYAPWKMQIRNEYMVDKSDKLIALWDGSEGGTFNCVEYANKQGKPIENLWERFNAQ